MLQIQNSTKIVSRLLDFYRLLNTIFTYPPFSGFLTTILLHITLPMYFSTTQNCRTVTFKVLTLFPFSIEIHIHIQTSIQTRSKFQNNLFLVFKRCHIPLFDPCTEAYNDFLNFLSVLRSIPFFPLFTPWYSNIIISPNRSSLNFPNRSYLVKARIQQLPHFLLEKYSLWDRKYISNSGDFRSCTCQFYTSVIHKLYTLGPKPRSPVKTIGLHYLVKINFYLRAILPHAIQIIRNANTWFLSHTLMHKHSQTRNTNAIITSFQITSHTRLLITVSYPRNHYL